MNDARRGPSTKLAIPAYTLAERVLIVPAAHVRTTDVRFQTEMYELFHRTTGARLGHMLGTPTVLFGLWMLAAQLPPVAAQIVAIAFGVYVIAWGVAVDRLVGALTAIGSAVLASTACVAAEHAGRHALLIAIALTLSGCAVQTFSHLFEDVPPPQSGSTHFVPITRWLRAIGPREIARSTALTFAVFYWLELWAAPRVWPLQILHLTMRAGHKPELRERLTARVSDILRAPEQSWRNGEPRGRRSRS